jgi:hypothetical protein
MGKLAMDEDTAYAVCFGSTPCPHGPGVVVQRRLSGAYLGLSCFYFFPSRQEAEKEFKAASDLKFPRGGTYFHSVK